MKSFLRKTLVLFITMVFVYSPTYALAVSKQNSASSLTQDVNILTQISSTTQPQYLPITSIKVGDQVLSENTDTGETGFKKVTEVIIKKTNTFKNINLGDMQLKMAPDMQVYILARGWTSIKELAIGDRVHTYGDAYQEIKSIDNQVLPELITYYNLKVEDWSSFCAYKSNILFHDSSEILIDLLHPIYFSQCDVKWKDVMYSNHNDPNQTIGNSGCGPTAMSMIVSTLRYAQQQLIVPPYTSKLAVNWGYRTYDNGTAWDFLDNISKRYDIQCTRTNDFNFVFSQLKKGKCMVVASMMPGHFTRGGHFIVLSKTFKCGNTEWVKVLDPNSQNKNYGEDGLVISPITNNGRVLAHRDVIRQEAKMFWVCYK